MLTLERSGRDAANSKQRCDTESTLVLLFWFSKSGWCYRIRIQRRLLGGVNLRRIKQSQGVAIIGMSVNLRCNSFDFWI